jgi:hypothetical protein
MRAPHPGHRPPLDSGLECQALAARAQSAELALAGLAYAGDAASPPQRFLHSLAYEKLLNGASTPPYAALREATAKAPPQKFRLVGQSDDS